MANVPSDQLAAIAVRDLLKPSEIEGRVRVAYAKMTGDQTLAQNDTVTLFTLPKGARPLAFGGVSGAFGASVTFDIGKSAGAAEFVAAVDISAAAQFVRTSLDLSALTADTLVYGSFEGANPADNVNIEVYCLYVTA